MPSGRIIPLDSIASDHCEQASDASVAKLTVNGWQLNITGAHNRVRLQRSSDLQNWEDVGWPAWVWMGSEGVKQVTDWWTYEEGQRMMFYRVIVE